MSTVKALQGRTSSHLRISSPEVQRVPLFDNERRALTPQSGPPQAKFVVPSTGSRARYASAPMKSSESIRAWGTPGTCSGLNIRIVSVPGRTVTFDFDVKGGKSGLKIALSASHCVGHISNSPWLPCRSLRPRKGGLGGLWLPKVDRRREIPWCSGGMK